MVTVLIVLIEIATGMLAVQGPIGSGLRNGLQLTYESGGVAQQPWVYESVRVVERDAFDRCVIFVLQGQPERESCSRGDTLFERRASGELTAARPLAANMELSFRTSSGNVVTYTTAASATVSLPVVDGDAGLTIVVVSTEIATRDSTGTVVRRLREQYAPSLLTAVRGVFEVPDGKGGWRTTQEFALAAVVIPVDRQSAQGESTRSADDRGLAVPVRRR